MNHLTYGANDIEVDVAGFTIEQITIAHAETLNLDPAAVAYVDGVQVDSNFVVEAGQRVEWVRERGEKGGEVWSEKEFRERYLVNDDELQECIDAGMPFVRAIENAVALKFGVKIMEQRLAAGLSPDAIDILKPSWNPDERTLKIGQIVIKSFRQPAKNQIMLLEVFEEEGWPHRIDDPLTPGKVRQTVADLNRNHITKGVLRFRMNGTGKAVTWEVCSQPE